VWSVATIPWRAAIADGTTGGRERHTAIGGRSSA
jgi:hypothetical protein